MKILTVYYVIGFVSLQVSYYTGLNPSDSTNLHPTIFGLLLLIAGLVMISVFCFNKIYLRNKAVPLVGENISRKNIVGFKTLIGSVFFMASVVLMFTLIQFTRTKSSRAATFPFGPFLSTLTLTSVNCYFAMKSYVREYSALQIKKLKNTYFFRN